MENIQQQKIFVLLMGKLWRLKIICLDQGNSTSEWLNVMTEEEIKVLDAGPGYLQCSGCCHAPKLLDRSVLYFFHQYILVTSFTTKPSSVKYVYKWFLPYRATMGIK